MKFYTNFSSKNIILQEYYSAYVRIIFSLLRIILVKLYYIGMIGKISSYIVALTICLFICSCAKNADKQTNKKLAQNYYKLCMLEFSDKTAENTSPEVVYKRALQHIDRALSYYQTAEYMAVKATLLFRLNDFTNSCNAFEAALKLDPDQQIKANVLNNYACLLSQIGNHDKALKILEDVEKDNAYITPQAAIFNQGRILFDMHNYRAAAQSFSRAIQMAPDFLDARYYLALSAFNDNDFTTAKSEVNTILFLEPEHDGALWLKSKL